MIATVALALAFSVGLRFVGWFTIPLVAAAWGYWFGAGRWAGGRAVVAVVVACVVWFAYDVARGRFGVLVRTVSGVFAVPGGFVIFLTFVLAGALAWSAATVGVATSQDATSRRDRT